MKSLLVFLCLSVLIISCKDKKIKRDQAKQIIINKIVLSDSLSHDLMIFLTANKLKKGDRIAPKGFPEETIKVKSPTWFAWVDDEPDAEFGHDTRFVLLNSKNGKLKIIKSHWYPVLNDSIILWTDCDKWYTDDLLIFSNY